MNSYKNKKTIAILACFLFLFNLTQAQLFNDSSSYLVRTIEGGATWTKDTTSGDFIYDNGGTASSNRSVMYSDNAYQSEFGFRLTIEYTTGSLGDDEGHNLSFGLISDDTDLSAYTGLNPFSADSTVYSIGVNVTTSEDAKARGMNFTNGTERITLDESGTRTQFETGETTKVFIEIGEGGFWSYYINGEYEESGVVADGFDLSRSYHLVIYGQDDNGGGKSIQSIKLEKAPAPGERAVNSRGTWLAGAEAEVAQLKNLKTLDFMTIGINWGAAYAAYHPVPNKLMEIINGDDVLTVCPTWGDLSLDEPEVDAVMDRAKEIRAAGFQVQAYSNCQNFMGGLGDDYLAFQAKWKAWCDTSAVAQAFINSQPFHTGIWDANTQSYVDATSTYPERKYMFCYAEFIIKENSIRYGPYIDRWVYDSGGDIASRGDNSSNGIIEDQRLYQAFANASRAGNPDIAIAFNNGRSSYNYFSYPFAQAVRFEDFSFGHAFGGNNNHAEKVNGNQFNLNYQYVTRMMETNAYVFEGNDWPWDDKIIGNFNSKLATTSWTSGPTQAWEEADFLKWNLEAVQAGGSMSWSGSVYKNTTQLRDWAYNLIKTTDDYLAKYQYPDIPNWARAYTNLPEAVINEEYYHELVNGVDFWDPEGDNIVVSLLTGAPSWLNIKQDSIDQLYWILSGTPTEIADTLYQFEIQITDADGNNATREVELQVREVADIKPVSGINLLSSGISLAEGTTQRLSATISPYNASNKKVNYSSSNTSVATVSSRGLVTAITPGSATITVTSDDGGYTAKCDVEVTSLGANIAQEGAASQSSTQNSAVAQNAIDGDVNGALSSGSVSQTNNEDRPWWQLEFDTDKKIDYIVVWNRTDECCKSELSNFTVEILNNQGASVFQKTFSGELSDTSVIIVTDGIQGRFVKVQLSGIGYLSLAEVQVFGSAGGISHIEAEDFTEMSGVQTEACSEGTLDLGYISSGDWSNYKSLEFESGKYKFEARVASKAAGGNIEIRTGSKSGELLGLCEVKGTGGWQTWTTVSCELEITDGVHDIYLVYTNGEGNMFNLNYFSFTYLGPADNTSIHNMAFDEICNIYPNPATRFLHYEFKNSKDVSTMAIYSLSGQQLLVQEIECSSGNIDVRNLSSGFYILKIMGNETVVTRFVKQ